MTESKSIDRAQNIFLNALDITSEDARSAYIDAECLDDSGLREEVEGLLRHARRLGNFLENVETCEESPAATAAGQTEQNIGKQIGPYTIRERIAEGGMGQVYVAEQTRPIRRKVALKIIRAGMASKEVLARFEAERQALAMMDHPNIARVLEGGTTPGGQPYFVMEFVPGVPITRFADAARLSIKERLEVFAKVCRAVQHAHQKGIIHRDLKPSNILVAEIDGKALPKVIDFGLAKALDQQLTDLTLYTRVSTMLGTPMYMSPEQASMGMLDVDTRSDVYSLGVLLYELLTGDPPHDARSFRASGLDEIRRMIREDEPKRPSAAISTLNARDRTTLAVARSTDPKTLSSELRGELEWIVLKTLEKDRSRRYQAAGDLADDIERHLSGEPIEAAPPSRLYRFSKYVSRHRVLLTTATVVLLTALLGTGVSLWYANVALRALEKADHARQDAQGKAEEAQRATRRFQELLYVADMKLASDAIIAGDARGAAELLDRHAPKSHTQQELTQSETETEVTLNQGFEWHLYRKLNSPPESLSISNGGQVRDLALSPEGSWLASTTDEAEIRMYRMATHSLDHTFPTSGRQVNGLAWSDDGGRLAAACEDGSVVVFDFPAAEVVRTIPAHDGGANDVGFNGDGTILFSCGDDGLAKSWELKTGTLLRTYTGHQREVEQLARDPTGEHLATASSDSSIVIWDVATGERLHRFEDQWGRAVCISYSRNGRFVAAGTIEGQLLLIEARSGKLTRLAKLLDGVEGVAFLDADRWVATADRGGAIQLHKIPDSDTVFDRVDEVDPLRWFLHEGRALVVKATQDGRLVSGGRDGQIRISLPNRDATRWELYREDGRRDATTGPHGRLFVAGDSIFEWDLDQRRIVDSFLKADRPWTFVECSRDGKWLAAARAGRLVIIDLATRKIAGDWPLEPRLEPYRLALSHSGQFAALAEYTDRKFVDLFRRGSADRVARLEAHQCECLAFSPSGRWLAAGHMDDLRLFDLDDLGHFRTLGRHESTLSSAAFSPDGRRIATVGHDRLLKIWSLPDGKLEGSVVAHSDWIRSLAFSPDGRTILTHGDDQWIKAWHARTVQTLGGFRTLAQRVRKLQFDLEGMRIAAVSNATQIAVFDAAPRRPMVPGTREESLAEGDAWFEELGSSPLGNMLSNPFGISRDGSLVVGCSNNRTQTYRESFSWSRAGGVTIYSSDRPRSSSQINSVSDDGSVACGSGACASGWGALLWDAPDDEPQVISGGWSDAVDLTADGDVLVGHRRMSGRLEAFRWVSDKLSPLPRQLDRQHASVTAITPDGDRILGAAFDRPEESTWVDYGKASQVVPVLWEEDRPVPISGFDPKYNWLPRAISDDGQVIVGVRWKISRTDLDQSGSSSNEAFRWESGRVALLGSLPGFEHSDAQNVSGNGRIIVGQCTQRDYEHSVGFIWDAQQGMRTVPEQLARAGISPAGWQITKCHLISSEGRTIAGRGFDPRGRKTGWVARLPAESSSSP